MSAKERLAYELSLAAERDLAACMATSFEEGEEKGMAKGKAEGIAEGIAEGMRNIIRNMKQTGMDLMSIVQATGLQREEVEALLK
ncbi:MAG: hypothetical protein J6K31_12085 [Parabacteroides sp.]|nr:hypothetical protein [Parabacteroides sp.]